MAGLFWPSVRYRTDTGTLGAMFRCTNERDGLLNNLTAMALMVGATSIALSIIWGTYVGRRRVERRSR
jgi:hypothetical protein